MQAPSRAGWEPSSSASPDVQCDVALAPYTTFGIGGRADFFAVVHSLSQMVATVQWAQQTGVEWFVLGCGANILVGDLGFRGLVIKNESMDISIEHNVMTVGSGATVAQAIGASVDRELSGLEHFVGIPSTLGGALWQNLHFLSPDRSQTLYIGEIVCAATVLVDGVAREVAADYFQFGYDFSVLHMCRDVVLDVTLTLAPSDKPTLEDTMRKNLAWRNAKHPPEAARMSAGSVFRKIQGIGAGRLIEEAGLKGTQVGDAEVSHRHANYILNRGHATASDVRQLIELVKSKVAAETGYVLEPEISFVGDFSADQLTAVEV